jgi:general secretion pathway protein G
MRFKTRTFSHVDRGMTLIEVMVVVMIISLLMGAVGLVAWQRMVESRVKITQQSLVRVEQAVAQFNLLGHGDCPADLDELVSTRILTRRPTDAWGEPLLFRCPAEENPNHTVDVWSKGKDRTEGTEDDICSWKK